jgi:hypothetical protein
MPLPSYILIHDRDMTLGKGQGIAARVVWQCIRALVVKGLVAGVTSSNNSDAHIGYDELEFISDVLRITSDVPVIGWREVKQEVKSYLRCPGTVELANMVSLAFGDAGILDLDSLPSDVRDVAKDTLAILSRTAELQGDHTITQLNIMNPKFNHPIVSSLRNLLQRCISGPSIFTNEERRSCLRMCLRSLWYFAKAYQQLDASKPFPSYFPRSLAVAITSLSLEVVHLIQAEHDLDSRVIGHCFCALVVMKLVASVRSRTDSNVQSSNDELAWLSAILGIQSDDVKFCLERPGAVELATMVPLVLYTSILSHTELRGVKSLVDQTLAIFHRTLGIPSHLVDFLSCFKDLLQMCISGTSTLTAEVRRSCLRMCLKSLWYCVKASSNQLDDRLPSFFLHILLSPEIIRCIQTVPDPVSRVMGCCFSALVVMKLVAALKSRNGPNVQISGDELTRLSAIFETEGRTLKNWLGQPGAVELASLFSLTLSGIDALFANKALDVLDDMVQQTSSILTRTLPAEFNIELMDLTDGQCEAILLSCLRDCRSESCLSGTSPPTEPIYESRVHVYLKNLWHCARASNQLGISVHLPSFVRITLAKPEFTRRIQTERDLAARVTGRCACALIVNKLVDDFPSRISFGNGVYNEELACISSLLGTVPGKFSRWPRPPAVIKLQNVVTLVSGEIEALLSSEQTPTDTLHTVQQTLNVICSDLVFGGVFAVGDLPMDQVSLLREICSRIANARPANYLFIMDETAEILGQLQQISKQLPTAEHKMRRCTSSVFDPRSVRGRGNLTTRPEYEVRRRRSKSM